MKKGFIFNLATLKFLGKFTFKNINGEGKTEEGSFLLIPSVRFKMLIPPHYQR